MEDVGRKMLDVIDTVEGADVVAVEDDLALELVPVILTDYFAITFKMSRNNIFFIKHSSYSVKNLSFQRILYMPN